MKKKVIHIVPCDEGWGIRKAESEKLTKILPTKKEAEEFGHQMAINQKTELIIHGKDGKIQDKDSYGKDPYPPKDKKH